MQKIAPTDQSNVSLTQLGLLYFLYIKKKLKMSSSFNSSSQLQPSLQFANSTGSEPIIFNSGSYSSSVSILYQHMHLASTSHNKCWHTITTYSATNRRVNISSSPLVPCTRSRLCADMFSKGVHASE